MILLRTGRLLLFFISSFGYWEYFRKKSGMNVFFLPAFTVALQVTILFFAGILNCLQITVFLMFGIGLGLAVYSLARDAMNVVRIYLNVGYIFLAISVMVILLATKGQLFTHYDNFSHWALVVRSMLASDRYPSFKDTMIQFQAYPLGSASFIYYLAKIVSTSEGMQMFAQAFMMLCFIMPVFKYVGKYKVISCIYVILFTNYLFVYNTAITDLLVDTLLPLQGMAMLFFVCSECNDFQGEKGVSVLYAAPFLCTSVLIKNSGIFFVAIAWAFLILSLKCQKVGRRQKVITMVFPFVTLFLWKAHCGYVFMDAASSKHAMAVGNYQSVFSSKTRKDIINIFFGVLKYSVTGSRLYFLLAFLAVLGILSLLDKSGAGKRYLKTVTAACGLYITYMVGIFLIYLFSMPGGEATGLAGIERYRSTVFVAVYYLLMVMSLMTVSTIGNRRKEWVYLVTVFTVLVVIWRGGNGKFDTVFADSREYSVSERLWLQQAISKNRVMEGKNYIMCISPGQNSGYIYYLSRYLLYPNHVSVRIVQERSQMDDFQGYDYIFVCDEENEVIKEWITEKYPEQEGKSVITVK